MGQGVVKMNTTKEEKWLTLAGFLVVIGMFATAFAF